MRKAPLVAALLVAPLAAYLAAACVVAALEQPLPIEDALALHGHRVERAFGGPAAALAPSPEPAALLVLPGRVPLSDAQRDAALAFAEDGGEVWLLTPGDAAAHLGGAAEGLLVLPGRLTPVGDGERVQAQAERGEPVDASGLRALALSGDAWRPLLQTNARSFRDTSGNGELEGGEPAGPFVVAAERAWGSGRLVVVGAQDAAAAPGGLVPALARDATGARAVVLLEDPAPFWGLARAVGAVSGQPAASPWWALAALAAGAGAALLPFTSDRAREARAQRREGDLVARYRKAAAAPADAAAGSRSSSEESST